MREPLYKTLATDRPAWARVSRNMLDFEAPPVETKAEPPSFTKVDTFAALQSIDASSGMGDILRPRQEAVNMFSAALRGGNKFGSPCTASLGPELSEVRWTPEDAARKRASEQEKARQKEMPSARPPLTPGILPRITPDTSSQVESQGRGKSLEKWCSRRSRMGAAPTRLAHLQELSETPNMEAASRFEKAQHSSGAHVARERGNFEIIKGELAWFSGGRLRQCVRDQQSEFLDRQRAPGRRPPEGA